MVSKKEFDKIIGGNDTKSIEKVNREAESEIIKNSKVIGGLRNKIETESNELLKGILEEQLEFHEGILKWNEYVYKRSMSKIMELTE